MHIKPLPFILVSIWAIALGYFIFFDCLCQPVFNVPKALIGIAVFGILLSAIIMLSKRMDDDEKFKKLDKANARKNMMHVN